jgi:phosphate:Na+ symporter
MGTLVLLDLMGGVALLLWGLHMVQSGTMRAFGPDLRRLLSKALLNRFAAFGAGAGLTALLQSSTATGLMTASFAAEGVVGLVQRAFIIAAARRRGDRMKRRAGAVSKEYWPPLRRGPRQRAHSHRGVR